MTPPPFDDTQLLPLITDADIRHRVEQLIGEAYSRQLWLMFLDELGMQLPLLIPIDDLPELPTDDETERLIALAHEVMIQLDAASIITVFERYGTEVPTPEDRAWAASLRRACSTNGVKLRAQLRAHRNGVSWIIPDSAD